MDDRQRATLGLAAVNSVVVPAHVMVLLKVAAGDATAHLDALVTVGLLERDQVPSGASPCYRITRAGLSAIGSALPVPTRDLSRLHRDIGAAWLWLATAEGVFGQTEWFRSRRELAARGEPADADLVMAVRGAWVAAHVQMVPPERSWLERVLRRYADDPHYRMALFMVEDDAVGSAVQGTASELGLSDMTMVQRFTFG
jgi:hypothetical protein